MKLFITISVMLNILLIGIGIGYGLRSPWLFGHRPPPPPPPAGFSELDEGARQRFDAALKRTRKEGEEMRKEIRETRERMEKILTADAFDEAAYEAESEKIAKLYNEQRIKMNAVIKELAKDASKAEREVLAKVTRRPVAPPPPPPHGGPLGDGPPPPPPGEPR